MLVRHCLVVLHCFLHNGRFREIAFKALSMRGLRCSVQQFCFKFSEFLSPHINSTPVIVSLFLLAWFEIPVRFLILCGMGHSLFKVAVVRVEQILRRYLTFAGDPESEVFIFGNFREVVASLHGSSKRLHFARGVDLLSDVVLKLSEA